MSNTILRTPRSPERRSVTVLLGGFAMEFDLSFLDRGALENASPREQYDFAIASLTFKKHKVLTTPQASLLFKLGFLKMNAVDKPQIRTEPFQYVWLTADGEVAITELMKSMGLSVNDLETIPDPIEDDILDEGIFTKFLMHRARLEEELNASWSRSADVVKRYAIRF